MTLLKSNFLKSRTPIRGTTSWHIPSQEVSPLSERKLLQREKYLVG